MFNLFQQRKAKLCNGKEVKEGDDVYFISSDGKIIIGTIERRKFDCKHVDTGEVLKKGTLYFWNTCFKITDYPTLNIGFSAYNLNQIH